MTTAIAVGTYNTDICTVVAGEPDLSDCYWPLYVEQIEMMRYSWSEYLITETGVAGTIGMWGEGDYYFFYLEF